MELVEEAELSKILPFEQTDAEVEGQCSGPLEDHFGWHRRSKGPPEIGECGIKAAGLNEDNKDDLLEGSPQTESPEEGFRGCGKRST
jgi:hypothetical protein